MGKRLPNFWNSEMGLRSCACAPIHFIDLRYALTLLPIILRQGASNVDDAALNPASSFLKARMTGSASDFDLLVTAVSHLTKAMWTARRRCSNISAVATSLGVFASFALRYARLYPGKATSQVLQVISTYTDGQKALQFIRRLSGSLKLCYRSMLFHRSGICADPSTRHRMLSQRRHGRFDFVGDKGCFPSLCSSWHIASDRRCRDRYVYLSHMRQLLRSRVLCLCSISFCQPEIHADTSTLRYVGAPLSEAWKSSDAAMTLSRIIRALMLKALRTGVTDNVPSTSQADHLKADELGGGMLHCP